MNKKPTLLLLISIVLSLHSCTPKHMLVYFQTDGREEGVEITAPTEHDYKLMVGDNLYIEVLSIDEDVSKVYNGIRQEQGNVSNEGMQLKGFLVSPDGTINFPFLGEVYVKNKTLSEVETLISETIDIEQTKVIARLVDRSISILGEVRNPGKFSIVSNQINIYEAISLAGDITDYGNRTEVTIIHQEGEKRIIRKVDLTDGRILEKDAGSIFPNDIIYIEPLGRSYGHKTINVPLALSILTSIVALVVALASV